jgi:hypothetical protein
VVGRQLGVRIQSHRPSKETEARPDQLHGGRNADTLGANWGCLLVCVVSRSLQILENKLLRTIYGTTYYITLNFTVYAINLILL